MEVYVTKVNVMMLEKIINQKYDLELSDNNVCDVFLQYILFKLTLRKMLKNASLISHCK